MDVLRRLFYLSVVLTAGVACAQSVAPPAAVQPVPLVQPTLSPGLLQLFELEGRFQQDVAKGGGKAFAAWFADDAVTLNDGQPAVLGRMAIAAGAVWDPGRYVLTWVPQGGQMGAAGDTGFTWGHYVAKGTGADGKPFTTEGRYITFWKKVGKEWKVALDASARDAASPVAAAPVTDAAPVTVK